MATELKSATEVFGISIFDVLRGTVVPRAKDFPASVRKADKICSSSSNECLAERLILALDRKWQDVPLQDVSHSLIEEAWSTLTRERLLPTPIGRRLVGSNIPIAGWAFHFRTMQGERILIAYFTGEISNDRHRYAEVLFNVTKEGLVLLRGNEYFVEMAGTEFLTWQVFLMFNLIGASMVCILAVAARHVMARQKLRWGS